MTDVTESNVVAVTISPIGPAGPEGPAGATGPQGASGLAGATGIAGTPGSNGAAGSTGPAGLVAINTAVSGASGNKLLVTDGAGKAQEGVATALVGFGTSPTALQSSGTYAANAGDEVLVDLSTASVVITLPNAPADKTPVGWKIVKFTAGHTLTITTAGSDVFEIAGGATSAAGVELFQAKTYRYQHSTGIWVATEGDRSLAQADARYAKTVATSTAGLVLASAGDGATDGTWTLPSGLLFGNGITVTENFNSGSPTLMAEHQFMMAPRPAALAYPVPFTRPTTVNSIVAWDLGPNGTPVGSTETANGVAWADICNYDFYGGDITGATQNGATLRLAVFTDHAEVSTRHFGGGVLPLYLSSDGAAGVLPQIYLSPQTATFPAALLGYDGKTDFFVGPNAAIPTTAAQNFLFLPTMAGTPTGVPHYTSQVPVVFDKTGNKVWFYNAGWKGVVVA